MSSDVTSQNWREEAMSEKDHARHQHELMEARKLLLARYIAATVEVSEIRRVCLDRMAYWRSQGISSLLWNEWEILLTSGTDNEVIHAMTVKDSYSKNLRRAGPYADLINPQVREHVWSQALTDLPSLKDLISMEW